MALFKSMDKVLQIIFAKINFFMYLVSVVNVYCSIPKMFSS